MACSVLVECPYMMSQRSIAVPDCWSRKGKLDPSRMLSDVEASNGMPSNGTLHHHDDVLLHNIAAPKSSASSSAECSKPSWRVIRTVASQATSITPVFTSRKRLDTHSALCPDEKLLHDSAAPNLWLNLTSLQRSRVRKCIQSRDDCTSAQPQVRLRAPALRHDLC